MKAMIRCTLDQSRYSETWSCSGPTSPSWERPDGLRDTVFQLEEGVSFVHFVETDEDGPGPLPHLHEFQRYRTTLDQRCPEPPVMTVLGEIGSYGR